MAKSRSQYSLEILLGAKKASSFQSGINGAKNELEGMSSTAKKWQVLLLRLLEQ